MESLKPFTGYETSGRVGHSALRRIRPRSVLLLCGYHAKLFTCEAKLFWRTTDTSSKMESKINLGPFSFSGCIFSLLSFMLEHLTITVHDVK